MDARERVPATLFLEDMAALGDVAVFGRRINIGVNGLALTRTLLILI